MNAASRSKMSMAGSVTSPCTRKRIYWAAVSSRTGGVEFEGDDAGGFGFPHQGVGGVVGEIERHQRLEAAAGGQGGEDAFAVGQGIGHANHRGLEVGHDHGAAHLAGGVRQNVAQGVAVAQV